MKKEIYIRKDRFMEWLIYDGQDHEKTLIREELTEKLIEDLINKGVHKITVV